MGPYQKSFFITEPVSNNRFDYELRSHPEIYVPSLITGDLEDVKLADSVAIETFVGGKLISGKGLKHFVFFKKSRVPTWISDNHNHAFVFWHEALQRGYIQPGSFLVHIDQHTDLATPQSFPEHKAKSTKQKEGFSFFEDFEAVEEYANTVLTIADFIIPALATELVSEALMVTGENREGVNAFIWQDNQLMKIQNTKDKIQKSLIVDIDLDYFSQGFDENETFATVRYWLAKADIITIATSPLFIEQEKALSILKSLQKELLLL